MAHDPEHVGESAAALVFVLALHLHQSDNLSLGDFRALVERFAAGAQHRNPSLAPMASKLIGLLRAAEGDPKRYLRLIQGGRSEETQAPESPHPRNDGDDES